MLKQPKIRSKAHLRFVASLPCVVTGRSDVQSAHIRKGTDGGAGLKPSDCFVIPLSVAEHALQHKVGELRYWYPYGGYEKATALAKALYENTGNREKCLQLIAEFRHAFRNL